MLSEALTSLVSDNLVLLVVLGLALIWFSLSMLIGLFSGWYALARAYPDRPERGVARRARVNATMGSATLNGLLSIEVCPSGLRFALNRLFVPFAHRFLVPWSEIEIKPKNSFMPLPRTIVLLGPAHRKLTLAPEVISVLMRDAASVWPSTLMLPIESDDQLARRLFKQWLVATLIATVLLTVLPTFLMDVPSDNGLLALGIAIPAITIGINYLLTYFRYRRGA
jgi:hypothetical protein